MGSVVFLFTCTGKHGDDLPPTSCCGLYVDLSYPRFMCLKLGPKCENIRGYRPLRGGIQ